MGNGHALKIDILKYFDRKFPSLIGINNNKYSKNRFKGFEHYKPINSYEWFYTKQSNFTYLFYYCIFNYHYIDGFEYSVFF